VVELEKSEDLESFIKEALENSEGLSEALKLFEYSQDQYYKAIKATTSTRFYTTNSSNPRGPEDAVLE
jgi:hypothetical protein